MVVAAAGPASGEGPGVRSAAGGPPLRARYPAARSGHWRSAQCPQQAASSDPDSESPPAGASPLSGMALTDGMDIPGTLHSATEPCQYRPGAAQSRS